MVTYNLISLTCTLSHASPTRFPKHQSPQCQGQASAKWCDQQLQTLLPVPYFHVVFTLPHTLNAWFVQYPALIYDLLFQCAWQTLKTLGADPKRLDGQMGMVAVLHTWGQNLSRHVHLHCLVPGGAFNTDNSCWHAATSTHLFPVKVMSRLFRGKMVSAVRQCWQQQRMPDIKAVQLKQTLDELMQTPWVVYSRATLRKANTVVKYLSRYTYRIAISERRLLSMDDDSVRFAWHDYRDDKDKSLRLDGGEFVRRYLQHVLPKGFMRIRRYGFLANRCQAQVLAQIRECLLVPASLPDKQGASSACYCPQCHQPQLRVIFECLAPRLTEG